MWEKISSLFQHRDSGERQSHHSRQRRQSDPLGNLSELSVPPPVENRSDSKFYRHHSLEENLRRNEQGEENEFEDDGGDVIVHHHDLEDNLELAKELSKELRKQSQELRRLSTEHERFTRTEDRGPRTGPESC